MIKQENRKLYRRVFLLALPIALQNLISSCLGLLDNLMVGALGEAELAAVGVGTQLSFLHWMMLFGFTSGCSTFMAQYYGANDMHSIRKTVGFAFSVAFSVSIIFFIAANCFTGEIVSIFTDIPEALPLAEEYLRTGSPTFLLIAVTVPLTAGLRTTQQTQLPLYISTTAFLTNTIMNYILIFGNFGAPELGVRGAAVATVISRSLEAGLILFVIFALRNKIAGPLREFFGFDRKFVIPVVKNAIPTTLNESLWGLGTSMFTVAFAHMSVTAYAAVQASDTIKNVFMMAGFSIGDAALILIGQKLGERDKEEAFTLAVRLLRVDIIIGVIAGVLLALMAPVMAGFFNFTPLGNVYAIRIIWVYALFLPVNLVIGYAITGVLRGGGDTTYAMTRELACVWLIGVPIAFISTMLLNLPVYLAVLCVRAGELTEVIILVRRIFSKKWLNIVIDIDEK
ncbi:MAG: MATE family efflux transporter [Clostridia bacterium]|nr:MATE family efflux transporter [Clostridia bacterium]